MTQRNVPWWPLIVAASTIFLLWFANLYFLSPLSDTDRGTFGDMFGAVNALFSGGAFAGVIYAIILSREELRSVREDLQYSKAILSKQADAILREERRQMLFAIIDQINSARNRIFLTIKKEVNGVRTDVTLSGDQVHHQFVTAQFQTFNNPDRGEVLALERLEVFGNLVEASLLLASGDDDTQAPSFEDILHASLSRGDKYMLLFILLYKDLPLTAHFAARRGLFHFVDKIPECAFPLLDSSSLCRDCFTLSGETPDWWAEYEDQRRNGDRPGRG